MQDNYDINSIDKTISLEDLEKLFRDLDTLKTHLEKEEFFSAQDLLTLKKILEEFLKIEGEVKSLVRRAEENQETETHILFNDALQKIYDAKIYLEDIYSRHHSKLGQYYSYEGSENNPDHKLHSQKSPTQKLMSLMAGLIKR